MKKSLLLGLFFITTSLMADDISNVYGLWQVKQFIAYPIGGKEEDLQSFLGTQVAISGDSIVSGGNVTALIDLRFENSDPLLAGNLDSRFVVIKEEEFVERYKDKMVLLTARLRYKTDYVGTGKTGDGYVYTNYAYISSNILLVYGNGAVFRLARMN